MSQSKRLAIPRAHPISQKLNQVEPNITPKGSNSSGTSTVTREVVIFSTNRTRLLLPLSRSRPQAVIPRLRSSTQS